MSDKIVLSNGKELPEFKLTADLFINKLTVLYGPTRSGKTVIVQNILKKLRKHIDQIIVVCPTEPSHKTYEKFVPKPLIHYSLGSVDPSIKKDTPKDAACRFLQAIYDRQTMVTNFYQTHNKAEKWKEFYKKIPGRKRQRSDEIIDRINRRRDKVIEKIRREKTGVDAVDSMEIVSAKHSGALEMIYKKYVRENFKEVKRHCSNKDREILYYIEFNPKIVLVLDDCAADLGLINKTEIFRRFFYQGRHCNITTVICCQDDTDLNANLRKNAMLSIFTSRGVCLSNFTRQANNVPNDVKNMVTDAAARVFKGHRKFVYLRDDDTGQCYYHLTCPKPKKFIFGSRAIQELCDLVVADSNEIDKSNKFYKAFAKSTASGSKS